MFKKTLAAAILLGCGLAQAFMPQSGSWVVNSELDGKPGRGMVVDAQNGTVALQMYAYENDGRPTFFLAAGPLVSNRFSGPLTRYSGGRYFGSGPRSGVEAGSPGQVSVRFTSGISGFITFPGEPEVAISRFNFGYPAVASSLRGMWTLTSFGSEGVFSEVVNMQLQTPATANGNGLMETADRLFGCEHQTRGNLAGGVLCVKITSSGQLLRSYYFVYSVNEGEGSSRTNGTRPEQVLVVKRLLDPQGVGTGIVYAADAPVDPVPTVLHDIIENLSFNAAPLPAEQE